MTLEEYSNQQHEIDLVVFHGIFKTQNAHGGRNVMPRCLSEGVDIFSKSVERQGRANRTFKASGCCHGWQLEPCPYGLEPLLTFRKKIPTGRPHIEEGHSVRRGRSWGLRQPYVTNHAPRFINVSQKALHIY